MKQSHNPGSKKYLKNKLYSIVFQSDTKAGKVFDLILLVAILLSVFVVIIETIPAWGVESMKVFRGIEWFFSILFSIEYFLRISISPKPYKYIFSFWGIIDFSASVPTFLFFLMGSAQFLIVVRLIRLLRVFRILKMVRYLNEARILGDALKASLYKITIFLSTVLVLVLILGTLMYVIERRQEGFGSIPQSIYWAIVTITTVGYGDLVPQTVLGKFISSVIMILGYGIIAVPTGIVTVEISRSGQKKMNCKYCNSSNPSNALYCNNCGKKLQKPE